MENITFEQAQKKAELIKELASVVEQQVYGQMDWVRARAYWEARLPMLVSDTAPLAEALAEVLCSTARHSASRIGKH